MPVTPAPDPETVAALSRVLAECVPTIVARSTVGLVASKTHHARQIGSGTLLAVADQRFVVTAAHVIRQAADMEATLGVSGTTDARFVAATGNWALSSDEGRDDENDIAIYELSPNQIARFAHDVFVRLDNVSFTADLSHAFVLVSGFPGMWSTAVTPFETTVRAKMLQYGTFSFQGTTAGLSGFNPHRHFLLEGSPSLLVDHKGDQTYFRTRSGHAASMPADLAGVSGCSVWILGDLRNPPSSWTVGDARLIGVETSVYKSRGAIRGTRWNAVTSLLYAAYPPLRPVLEMYARQHEANRSGA